MTDSGVEGGSENQLAFIAATSSPLTALKAWLALMRKVPFDEININTQRLAPAIFQNLRMIPDFHERERLRGSFKYTWTKNTRLIHAIQPILIEFERQGIDYRVIKGIGIQVSLDSVGARTVGDVDLLIGMKDVSRAVSIIKGSGYRRTEEVICSGHSAVGHYAGLDFSKGPFYIDLHVAEVKYPIQLLSRMLQDDPEIAKFGSFSMKVPSRNLLLLHALTHGEEAFGPTDFLQSIVDISQLFNSTDYAMVSRDAKQVNLEMVLYRFYERLESEQFRNLQLELPVLPRLPFIRARSRWDRIQRRIRAVSLMARLQARSQGRTPMEDPATQRWAQRKIYRLWVKTGQIALAERYQHKYFGGLIMPPKAEIENGLVVSPFSNSDSNHRVTAVAVANQTLDWRFRVRIPSGTRLLQMQFHSTALESLEIHCIINGLGAGRLVGGDPTSHTITVIEPSQDLEVSLRPIWTACTSCYSGFDDLEIEFLLNASR